MKMDKCVKNDWKEKGFFDKSVLDAVSRRQYNKERCKGFGRRTQKKSVSGEENGLVFVCPLR